MPQKILVTGGAGYIGSKFCYDAIDNGYEVIIVDNLSTGNKKLIPQNATFYKYNISDTNKINSIFTKHKIKSVIHFASSLSVEESMKNPIKYYLNKINSFSKSFYFSVWEKTEVPYSKNIFKKQNTLSYYNGDYKIPASWDEILNENLIFPSNQLALGFKIKD